MSISNEYSLITFWELTEEDLFFVIGCNSCTGEMCLISTLFHRLHSGTDNLMEDLLRAFGMVITTT